MSETNRYDTIVIGAGLAGMCAALRLARTGHRVAVLERRAEVGGRARTDDIDGWLFNQGAHALYKNGPGHRSLRALGVEPQGAAPPLRGGRLAIDGRTTPLPIDAAGLLRTRALSTRSKLQFGRLMAGLPRLDPGGFAHMTVDEWLHGYRPDVAELARTLVRLATYSASTDVMSAEAAIRQLRGATDGVLYLHGGWASLCAQLESAVSTAGVAIVTGQTVTGVGGGDHRYTVTTAERELVASTVIVAAGGPAFTARLLGLDHDHFGPTGPAAEAAVLDLALDSMPTHPFVLGIDEPTYFSVHSPPARLAPDGRVAAVVMRYLAPDDTGIDAHRASLERIAALAGAPEPVHQRFLARMTVTHGLPLASQGGLAGRPPVAVSTRPGAFIAGDWVGAQGMLADAAITSGVAAADAAAAAIPSIAGSAAR